jgi:hypothetical protein
MPKTNNVESPKEKKPVLKVAADQARLTRYAKRPLVPNQRVPPHMRPAHHEAEELQPAKKSQRVAQSDDILHQHETERVSSPPIVSESIMNSNNDGRGPSIDGMQMDSAIAVSSSGQSDQPGLNQIKQAVLDYMK